MAACPLQVRMTFPDSTADPLAFVPGLPDCQDPDYFCPRVVEPARQADGLVLGPLLEKIPGNATVKLPMLITAREQLAPGRRRLQGNVVGCFASLISTAFSYIW